MALNLTPPDISELKPRITVFGVGGAGGNAVNNMITAGLQGVDFVVANTDAQALTMSKAAAHRAAGHAGHPGPRRRIRSPMSARRRRRKSSTRLRDHLTGANMVFVTAGMGGGTGTGAAPVIAKTAREMGILTVGVVTKPFHFEGARRMRTAESGIAELQQGGRYADRSSRTRTCSGSPTKRPPSPTPSRWPTRCSIRASPASPT